MKLSKKLQIASNIFFALGLGLLIWVDPIIGIAIFILGIAKLLEESAREKKADGI